VTDARTPLWADQKEGRTFTRLEVTTMLNGAMLSVPLHVVTGRRPGPVFGIVTNTHGDEFLPTIAIRRYISERGKIRARRVTGNCVQHQRDVALAGAGDHDPRDAG